MNADRYLASTPSQWPFDGDLRPANTALIVIDMQVDFLRTRRLRRHHGLRYRHDPPAY